MAKLTDVKSLATKTLYIDRIFSDHRRQELQGDVAPDVLLHRSVHCAKPTGPQHLQDSEASADQVPRLGQSGVDCCHNFTPERFASTPPGQRVGTARPPQLWS